MFALTAGSDEAPTFEAWSVLARLVISTADTSHPLIQPGGAGEADVGHTKSVRLTRSRTLWPASLASGELSRRPGS